MKNKMKLLAVAGLTSALFACGGGSSTTTTPVVVTPPAPAPTPATLSIANANIVEGDSGTTQLTFTVSLDKAASASVTVDYATSDGTATSADYTSTNGTLTFATGETTQTFSVDVIGDILYADEDGEETFNVTLTNGSLSISDATAIGTITNDDMTEAEAMADLLAKAKEHRNATNHWTYTFPMDLSNDGDDDIVVLSAVDNLETKQRDLFNLVYFTNNLGKGFTQTDTDIKMFARFVEVVDVDGDGYDDIISVDHGYDTNGCVANCNDYVRLVAQDSNGGLIDKSNQVESKYAAWHGLETLDIDNDGDADFIASGLHDTVYAFINDGTGNFTIDQNWLPINALNEHRGNDRLFVTSVVAIDINTDGYKEIVLGSDSNPAFYANNETGGLPILRHEVSNYTFDVTDTLDVFLGIDVTSRPTSVIVDMQPIDINSDSCDDLAVYYTDYSDKSGIKIYQSDCAGGLTLTEEFIKDGIWQDVLHIKDVNGDGLKDIYMTASAMWQPGDNVFYISNGDGTFSETNDFSDFDLDVIASFYINWFL